MISRSPFGLQLVDPTDRGPAVWGAGSKCGTSAQHESEFFLALCSGSLTSPVPRLCLPLGRSFPYTFLSSWLAPCDPLDVCLVALLSGTSPDCLGPPPLKVRILHAAPPQAPWLSVTAHPCTPLALPCSYHCPVLHIARCMARTQRCVVMDAHGVWVDGWRWEWVGGAGSGCCVPVSHCCRM